MVYSPHNAYISITKGMLNILTLGFTKIIINLRASPHRFIGNILKGGQDDTNTKNCGSSSLASTRFF